MADGIDINWTGATAIPMNGTITGNVCWFNGFFNQQTSQLTQDGGGITLRNVTHYTATGNFMRENAGVDMYLTNPTEVTVSSNVITKTVSTKAGIYVLYSATNLKINSNTVDVLGTALSMGGGMAVTRMDVSLNTLISSTAAAASFPANTYSNCSSRGNTYLGAAAVNLYFKSVDDRFRYQSALTGYGVYINMSYGKFEGADINGSTSSSLVYMDGGTGNTLSTCNINNTGSGVGLTINNGSRLMVLGCFLQCGSGVGASISGGYIDVMSTIFSGSTSVSSSATQLTYIGKLNQWTGTQTYTVFPWDTSVTQRTS